MLTSSSYIKELADRINTIEGKLNTNVDGLERSASNEGFASPGLVDESRKRPFANISGDAFQTPSPNRFSSTFTTDHRPILPYLHPDFRTPNSGGQAELGIKPAAPMPFPGAANEIGLQPQAEMMEGISQNGLPQGSSHQGDQMPEIEDAVFNRYVMRAGLALCLTHPLTNPSAILRLSTRPSQFWRAPRRECNRSCGSHPWLCKTHSTTPSIPWSNRSSLTPAAKRTMILLPHAACSVNGRPSANLALPSPIWSVFRLWSWR